MQTTNTVLMIEPVAFGFNSQTADNNYFQVNVENSTTQIDALREFRDYVDLLRSKGIEVIVVKDTLDPPTPDSIFPNNWVSFNEEGKVFLYPMFAPNRRDERRMEIIDEVKNYGFKVSEIVDLSASENEGFFLEGTGSIIFDHDYKIAYGSISMRLNEILFRDFCASIGYRPIVFHSYQTSGEERLPIYHTNVMMCVAEKFVVICLDAIDDEKERCYVEDVIRLTNKQIIAITEEQMHQFAGNMLQLHNEKGEFFLVMSKSAYKSLTQDQIQSIEESCEIVYSDLNTIEKIGGGSARCMLAEVFLPKK